MTEKKSKEEIAKEVIAKYQNISIFVPTYKIIPAVFFQAFFVTLQNLNKMGFKPHLFFVDNTNVCRARNALVGGFISACKEKEHTADICLWIDSDQTFDTSDIMTLLYHLYCEPDIQILSGRYITRDNTAPRVCGFVRNSKGEYGPVDPDMSGICEVDAFGFGFVAMYPKVLEDMYQEYGEHQFLFRAKGPKERGDIIGEDLDWCDKAQKIGYKLFFDNEIKIGHFGGIIDDDYLRYKLVHNYGLKKYDRRT